MPKVAAPVASEPVAPATDAGGVREALERAEADFEAIRLMLVKELDEPVRQAFWRAVSGRDAVRAALSAPAPAPESARGEAVAILRDLVSTLHIRGKMMTVSHDDLWALEKRARAYLAHPASAPAPADGVRDDT